MLAKMTSILTLVTAAAAVGTALVSLVTRLLFGAEVDPTHLWQAVGTARWPSS